MLRGDETKDWKGIMTEKGYMEYPGREMGIYDRSLHVEVSNATILELDQNNIQLVYHSHDVLPYYLASDLGVLIDDILNESQVNHVSWQPFH